MRTTAITLAAALLLGLASPEAHALALGRVSVQSTLGEPLRAEIDIPQITADEAASLRASIASAEAFRVAGVERNAVLADLQVSLQQRPGGGYVLRLTTERAIAEPFVDLILEASWSSGRIVRDYTLLLDPPNARAGSSAPVTPMAPQVAPPAQVSAPESAAEPLAATPPAPAPAPAPAVPAAAAASRPGQAGARVTVRAGDTASRLVAARKPSTVSLDQMLVALLRANPDAFIRGNVNRLKAGAVLEMPTEAQAAAVGAQEARQTVVAQSRDFNEFRRRLAQGIPAGAQAPAQAPGRQATGKLEAQVQDKRPAETAPDKLTLSKGAVEGRSDGKASEDRIARERAAQDAAARMAELSKNIDELNRLGASTGVAAPAASGASAAGGLGIANPLPAPPASAASSTAAAASAPASAASAAASRSAPSTTPGFLDSLFENPLVPAAAAGLIALIAGLAVYLRRRHAHTGDDSSFLESRLQPDSFFGGSGGQRIDTAEGPGGVASSMVYSPSQIDAAGDVDPVAEADVYLAYGRDLQAEEILKEALRSNPQRVAIHAKLLEIHARRHDLQAFNALAAEARALTHGQGPEWAHIAGLGLDLDPQNPMYQPDRWADAGEATDSGPATEPQPAAPAPAAATALDVDLDALDLGVDFARQPAGNSPASRAPQAPLPPLQDAAEASRDLAPLPAAEAVRPAPPPLPQALVDLDLNIPSFTPGSSVSMPPAPSLARLEPLEDRTETRATRMAPPSGGMIDFDLSGISLDLSQPARPGFGDDDPLPAADDVDEVSPLATKLALAEEFNAIGDVDGARSLAQEVLAEASGELRQRAERLLAELG